MYKSIHTQKGIKGVRLVNGSKIFGYTNGDLIINSKKIQANVDTVIESLKIFASYLFFDSFDNSYMYDLSNGKLYSIGTFRAYPSSLERNEIICTYDSVYYNKKFSWKTGLYNYEENRLIKEYFFLRDISIAYFLNKEVVITWQNMVLLNSISLLTGEYEWELDLSGRKNPEGSREENAQIEQLVGVWQNQLIITLSNGELVSVDTQTGNILWETQQLGTQINQGPPYQWRGHLSFNGCHIENGKLYEMVGSVYYCIDLITQAVEILWQDQRTEEYVTVQHRTYTEDYIYFTGSFNGTFQPHIVGVFNRKTLSLEWVEDMSLPILPSMGYPPSLNQAPQVDGDKLYVLDSGGTLHIFEKEND